MEFRDLLLGRKHVEIEKEVDPRFEAAEMSLSDQTMPWVARAKGFGNFRIAGNVISTRGAVAWALNTDVSGIPDVMMKAMEGPTPFRPVEQPDYYRELDIDSVPLPTYFPTDGGPYITSGIFHTGLGDKFNLSFHRMMYLGKGRFAVRVVPRHLFHLMKDAGEKGRELEAVISIGTDPAALFAGAMSLPFGMDEMNAASTLHEIVEGNPLELFSPTGDNKGPKAPTGTEIVLHGRFTGERASEGPFVDVTSTIDLSGMDQGGPVFEVDRVLAREDPIFHLLVPGGFEHYMMMGLPREPSILQSVRKVVPKVHAVRLTEGGCCWLHGIISITKQNEGDPKNAVMAAFSGHPSMKRVVVVDEDIDIFDDTSVEWALATRFQADRDMVVVEHSRGSTLDPSADPDDGTTAKLGLDATMPVKGRDPFRRVGRPL